jgi:cytochrome c5
VISKLSLCLIVTASLGLARLCAAASGSAPQPPPHPLVWDATEKTLEVKPDGKEARIQFNVTNKSSQPVEVFHIETSCGCTVPEVPSKPWIIAAGAQGSFTAVVDYQGKQGKFSKTLQVHSTSGSQMLTVIISIPDTEEGRRARNQQLAFVDRQAVFRGECASCHVVPTVGKKGADLFQAACSVCHDANPRASMVPDLQIARESRDAAYWERWISDGKEQTLMPGFAAKHGGPLTPEQVASLVEYAMSRFPTEPRKS